MPVKSPTPRSTRRLSEVARHVVYPPSIVSSGWPKVEAQCRSKLGIEFDGWQKGAGTLALGKDANGRYAATVGGVVLSIPRQVGKTFWVGAMIVALCTLFPGLTVLWTAHRTRTATRTFGSLQAMVKRPKVWPLVAAIRTTNGEQEIRFANGSVIMFGAREQGFGRGFDEVDIEVFDESQILTEKALDDMIPAANQARHESGGLIFYIGTPPRPVDPGEVFTNKRQAALAGDVVDMVYVEMSADDDADPDDWEQVGKANPSYPDHTPREAILRMRKNLSHSSYMREGLGIWDSVATVFGPHWARCDAEIPTPADFRLQSIGVAVQMDLGGAVLVGAGMRERDGELVPAAKILTVGDGVDWVVEAAARYSGQHRVPVSIAKNGPGASLLDPLQKQLRSRLRIVSFAQYMDGCADLLVAVTSGQVQHANQPELNAAAAGAEKVPVGDRWKFSRRGSVDIAPLEAMTLAIWGMNHGRPRSAADERMAAGASAVDSV